MQYTYAAERGLELVYTKSLTFVLSSPPPPKLPPDDEVDLSIIGWRVRVVACVREGGSPADVCV